MCYQEYYQQGHFGVQGSALPVDLMGLYCWEMCTVINDYLILCHEYTHVSRCKSVFCAELAAMFVLVTCVERYDAVH